MLRKQTVRCFLFLYITSVWYLLFWSIWFVFCEKYFKNWRSFDKIVFFCITYTTSRYKHFIYLEIYELFCVVYKYNHSSNWDYCLFFRNMNLETINHWNKNNLIYKWVRNSINCLNYTYSNRQMFFFVEFYTNLNLIFYYSDQTRIKNLLNIKLATRTRISIF